MAHLLGHLGGCIPCCFTKLQACIRSGSVGVSSKAASYVCGKVCAPYLLCCGLKFSDGITVCGWFSMVRVCRRQCQTS